jgi:hypothetical protein
MRERTRMRCAASVMAYRDTSRRSDTRRNVLMPSPPSHEVDGHGRGEAAAGLRTDTTAVVAPTP